jgi:hypothetical protein
MNIVYNVCLFLGIFCLPLILIGVGTLVVSDSTPIRVVAAALLLVVVIASCVGVECIDKRYTVVETETVEMTVSKLDAVDDDEFVVVFDGGQVAQVTSEQYADINIGDTVKVTITVESLFGDARQPVYSLA